jgi:hypothetical protein
MTQSPERAGQDSNTMKQDLTTPPLVVARPSIPA